MTQDGGRREGSVEAAARPRTVGGEGSRRLRRMTRTVGGVKVRRRLITNSGYGTERIAPDDLANWPPPNLRPARQNSDHG